MNYLSKKDTRELYVAFLSLKNEDECKRFLRDLLTEGEIKEFVNRFKVARMLDKKVSYKKIEKETQMSSTTIARINKWLTKGMGGYRLVIERFKNMNKKSVTRQSKEVNEAHHHASPRGGVIFSVQR